MKISLGLAASAAMTAMVFAGLSASADPTPRIKQNGEPCTAEEIANPPVVKVKLNGGLTARVKVECKTKALWRYEEAQAADQPRYKMASNRLWYIPGDTHNTLDNAPAGESKINGQ